MKIRTREEGEYGMTITFSKGRNSGESFSSVPVELEDGTKSGAWVSDKRPGFFKQVFVPYDFEHEALI